MEKSGQADTQVPLTVPIRASRSAYCANEVILRSPRTPDAFRLGHILLPGVHKPNRQFVTLFQRDGTELGAGLPTEGIEQNVAVVFETVEFVPFFQISNAIMVFSFTAVDILTNHRSVYSASISIGSGSNYGPCSFAAAKLNTRGPDCARHVRDVASGN